VSLLPRKQLAAVLLWTYGAFLFQGMKMQRGRGGMGSRKHAKSGHATKSPRFRFAAKIEAERQGVKSKRAIRDPKSSVAELFAPRRKT
jgi:hypothetical protein